MKQSDLPEDFLKLLETVKGKRARIVVNHILEYDHITTEDLEQKYGYKHPPRAVADVRDQGIPIETYTLTSSTGRKIAGYRFGNPQDAITGRTGGRQNFPRELKSTLYKIQQGRCAICNQEYDERYLQIDHRIPYLVIGEVADLTDNVQFMLLCRSCNRAKSWSCEHCPNGMNQKDESICQTCYWSNPDKYNHIATQSERRIELVWSHDEVQDYDELVKITDEDIQQYIKSLLRSQIRNKDDK